MGLRILEVEGEVMSARIQYAPLQCSSGSRFTTALDAVMAVVWYGFFQTNRYLIRLTERINCLNPSGNSIGTGNMWLPRVRRTEVESDIA